jgi:hypothetical protein
MAIEDKETMKLLLVMPGIIVGTIITRQIVAGCPKRHFPKRRGAEMAVRVRQAQRG